MNINREAQELFSAGVIGAVCTFLAAATSRASFILQKLFVLHKKLDII
jgi:hypothetical protein